MSGPGFDISSGSSEILPAGTIEGQALRWDGADWQADDRLGSTALPNFDITATDEISFSDGTVANSLVAGFTGVTPVLSFGTGYGVGAITWLNVGGDVSIVNGTANVIASNLLGTEPTYLAIGDIAAYQKITLDSIETIELNSTGIRLSPTAGDVVSLTQNDAVFLTVSNVAAVLNVGLFGSPTAGYGVSDRVLFIENATTEPGAAAGDGSFLWSDDQAVKSHLMHASTAFLAGANPALTGTHRESHGATGISRNAAGSADIQFWDFGSTTSNVPVWGSNGVTTAQVRASSTIQLNISNTSVLQISASTISSNAPAFQWSSTVLSPSISQADDTGAGATGDTMTIRSQNVTGGGASVGGALDLSTGSGTTHGAGRLRVGNGASTRFEWNNTGVGFNGQAPIARPDYTVTNLTVTRSLDCNTVLLSEVADTLGTLITDLITYGLLQ